MYFLLMARASTTSDAFNAVAEPRRREILIYLAAAERPVGEIVAALGLEQPSVSKHLKVLRDVGLVRMRCQGRQKLYRTNADAIRPLHEWAGTFERYWQHQLNRVKERAEQMVRQTAPEPDAQELNSPNPNPPNPANPQPSKPASTEKEKP
jgi:DNA-binding transcriptional ArsR family regulator